MNCNNTFVQIDSLIRGYGKWSLKDNNRLILQFDSISIKNTTKIDQARFFYIIEDGRIFRTKIPKKEFKNAVESHGPGWKFMSFSAYEEMELKRYYQKVSRYSCE